MGKNQSKLSKEDKDLLHRETGMDKTDIEVAAHYGLLKYHVIIHNMYVGIWVMGGWQIKWKRGSGLANMNKFRGEAA